MSRCNLPPALVFYVPLQLQKRGGDRHRKRVSTQTYLWRRKFSRRSCRDLNSQPFESRVRRSHQQAIPAPFLYYLVKLISALCHNCASIVPARIHTYVMVPKGLLTFLDSLYKQVAKTTSGTLVYRFERQTARKKKFLPSKTLCPRPRM